MKVYISNYRDHWVSPYRMLRNLLFWREDVYLKYEDTSWLVRFLTPLSQSINWILDRVHPKIDYVHVDGWDVWNMDHTLSLIVLPMLKRLQADKNGGPLVDDEDVPEELKTTSALPVEHAWDTDENWFKRWDYVLDEMIFAFEKKVKDDEDIFDDEIQKRMTNGFRLFGKYFEAL